METLSNVRVSGTAVAIAVVIGAVLLGLRVQLRGQAGMATADHLRQIKQMLVIYSGQFGGFPANLERLQERLGPIPAAFLRDAWGNPIRYDVSQRLDMASESGDTLYGRCDLRSAGPNEDMGDSDDIAWSGSADNDPRGVPGPPMEPPFGR